MLIYAHRGARGYAPENTMAAFQKAAALKAGGIELDVQMTADRQVVICHDHDIDRTSNGRGIICELTVTELKKYDFGSWFGPQFAGETIPTLDEFLPWFTNTAMVLNIEIKNGPVIYKGIEELVVAAVEKYQLQARTVVSSFYHPSLVKVKQLNPALKTGALFDCRPLQPLQYAEDVKADYLHPHWAMVEAEWVSEAHLRGIKVNAYTVNTPSEYEFVRKADVDGIFSDFPDRFIFPGA